MFLLTVQQNIQIFSFFSAIFRMLRFSKREKSTEKKINERWLKQRLNKQTKKELKITTTTWKKNKQKINILCFDSRRWKALNAADLYKSNLIKNDDLINQKLSMCVFISWLFYVWFISLVRTSNVELGTLNSEIYLADEMLIDLCRNTLGV